MRPLVTIEINLDSVKNGLRLYIDSRRADSLFDAEDNAAENNEARFNWLKVVTMITHLAIQVFYSEILVNKLFKPTREISILGLFHPTFL